MTRRWLLWACLIVVTLPLLVWGYDRLLFNYWVGSTDIEFEFVVADADTNSHVPGVTIEVQPVDRTPEGGGEASELVLVADETGAVRKLFRDVTCTGEQSGLRLTNSYAICLPRWWFRATAPGYQPSPRLFLDSKEYEQRLQRVDSHRTKLVVPVTLRKV